MEGELIGIGAMGVLCAAGLAIMLVPTKAMLSWDRYTGYCIYTNVLKSTGDEKKALLSAGVFYRIFGGVFFLVGGWFLSMALSVILTK